MYGGSSPSRASILRTRGYMINKRLLTEIEAAEYIGMSRSFLRQGRMDGVRVNCTPAPKWIKIGLRSVRYAIEDLDEWINSFPTFEPNAGKNSEII